MLAEHTTQPGPFGPGLATALPQKLQTLIENHFQDGHGTHFYSQQLGITQEKLNRLLITTTGKTLHQLVTERRLKEAKTLLQSEKPTIKAITYTLGFSDIAQFSKFFKKHTGQKPTDYRQEHQNKTNEIITAHQTICPHCHQPQHYNSDHFLQLLGMTKR